MEIFKKLCCTNFYLELYSLKLSNFLKEILRNALNALNALYTFFLELYSLSVFKQVLGNHLDFFTGF